MQQKSYLEGSEHRWQVAPLSLQNRDPYYFRNFKHAILRVEGYVDYIRKCGANWLGLNFKFPLIWWPTNPYREDLFLTKAEEEQCWRYWVAYNGFLEAQRSLELPYNFSSLHEQSKRIDSDLD